MRLPRSSGKPKRPKLLIRRVVGDSRLPTLRANQIVIATGWFHTVDKGDIVVFQHNGLEKIKRIERIDPLKGLYVIGDNHAASTDSRSFGWLDFDEIIAKVIVMKSRNS